VNKDHVNESFTKRYMLSVFIIALLSTAALTLLHVALKSNHSTAHIVTLSEKQRVLSQRIASLSSRYRSSVDSSSNLFLKNDLLSSIEEMHATNKALSSSNIAPTTITVSLSAHKEALYQRAKEYLFLAQHLLQMPSSTQDEETLNTLLNLCDILLVDFNKLIEQSQREGEAHIRIIKNLETGTWLLTLLVLLAEIIFIFQPMLHAMKELFQKTSCQYHELEQNVRIRTLDLEQSNLKLQHLASHDPLTGLKNRLHMEEVLDRLILHHKINHLPFGVAMIDIDWFKKVNDDYGHDAGDFVLCELAKIFSTTTRYEDTIFRSGGEEFVIVFNRIKPEDIMARCELLRQKVEQHCFVYKDVEIKLTISGGIYHPDEQEVCNIREILKHADTALYTAKKMERNKIIMAAHTLNTLP